MQIDGFKSTFLVYKSEPKWYSEKQISTNDLIESRERILSRKIDLFHLHRIFR